MSNGLKNKADELYNKLPLNEINEKLGGKVDVKTKKFKVIAVGVLAVLIVVILCLIFCGGGAPSSSEISACKSRINRIEKEYGHGRRCIKISDFKKMDPVTPSAQIAKLTGLKAGKKCDRYSCTVTWKDKKTSRGVFVRQGDRKGVFVMDWMENDI